MNTKTFAQQSRALLMQGVANKLIYWGFNTKGQVVEEPTKISGGYSFRGEVFDDANVLHLWKSLKNAIASKGIGVIVEEAAYTWFNRIMALKIMAKNGYDNETVDYVDGLANTPQILQQARQGNADFLNKQEQVRLQKIIGDYNKDQEAFALLLIGYCHSNKMMQNVFGHINDYTELLLPDNMLQNNGFLHLLNTTDAISDEEYQKVELIGWLYQFYISERKDEVFASFGKGKKAEAKDIPAATQIFTPNWIVKYMVQNTAGKIWLDKNPKSPLKGQMKYLVENENVIASGSEAISSNENENTVSLSAQRIENQPIIKEVTDITLIDPACGSGHILVEGFDLLYQMYLEEYYTPEEAVESILKNNLFGLDIDERAAQLATFAILLKAAQRHRDVFTKGWLPNVYAMPEEKRFSEQQIKDFLGTEGIAYVEELDKALRLMQQSKNLGSVMKLKLSDKAQTFIETRFKELENTDILDFNMESIFQDLKTYIPVLLLLTKKYTAVVANPPYLGPRNMNGLLKKYVDKHYPMTKADLFAVFLEVNMNLLKKRALMGMINQESWLFNSSYKLIRKHFIDNYFVENLLHLGTRTFQEVSGEKVRSVAFVIRNDRRKQNATFFRLTDYNSTHKKEAAFLNREIKYENVKQVNFHEITGSPFAYWISNKVLDLFKKNKKLAEYSSPRKGNSTSNNARFLRNWYEVNQEKCALDFDEISKALSLGKNWIPYNKGGGQKKWYGYNEYIIDWSENGNPIREIQTAVVTNEKYYMKPGLTWSAISGKTFGLRFFNEGFIFDNNGCCLFDTGDNKEYLASLLNSKVFFYIIGQLNPALAFHPGDVKKFPIILNNRIELSSSENYQFAKNDWDSRETSWDFEQSPLLNKNSNLKQAYEVWQKEVTKDFFQLHSNEEELNRVFIDIYGLQEELTPEVALKHITILQEELAKKDLENLEEEFRANGAVAIELPINKAEVISQFISYAIGLYMGRYRLDKTGLNIAHPNPTPEELAPYTFIASNSDAISTINIDEDAIIPLMGKNSNFADDALHLVNQLLDNIWGHETRIENSNFIQECLNKDLEKFLVNDFYKYHCGMYKKKPIYWLFSSKNGAFQALVYMHRMNDFTAEKLRANYLLEHLKNLRNEKDTLEANSSNLSTQEAKRLDQVRKDLIECEEYDMELKNIADLQIKFDLDDGVDANYKLFETVLAKIK